MRLLFVSHSLPPSDRPMENVGGMQRVAADLHDGLLSHAGIQVQSLVLRSAWSERHYRTPLFLARALVSIRGTAARGEVDAVLFSSMVTGALAVPLRGHLARRGVVSAAIANGQDVTTPVWPYPAFVPRVFRSLDAVLPISRATAAACEARGLPAEKCTVVPLGIRRDRFPSAQTRSRARSELMARLSGGGGAGSAGEPTLLICSVGRLVPRKGVSWFVDNVMPLLPEDVHYWVAGEGPEAAVIAGAVARNGLERRVRLLGAITDADLELLYRGADLFAMPNVRVRGDMEGFGLVMLEAGMCGLPVIAARLEGITDVITEGENGSLVESGDFAGFSAAVMKYYQNPRALSDASARAESHVKARFGWDTVTERYVEIMKKLAEEKRAQRS